MNKSFTLGIKLFVITSIAGLLLAFTNSLTEPIIIARQQQQLKDSLGVILENAENFEELDSKDSSPDIIGAYKGTDGSKTVGYVFEIDEPGGYGGNIHFLIGFDDQMKLTGFKSISHSESAGFGAKIDDPEFNEGLVGTDATKEVSASKDGSGENEILAISGATYSTSTIVNGINSAREFAEGLEK